MSELLETNALKEWASVVSALMTGDQVILLRKGGLADRSFGVKAPRFLLMPTYLHQTENQFRPSLTHHVEASAGRSEDDPSIEFRAWCEVVRSFEVRDLDVLLQLSDQVIFTDDTIRARFAFRPDQAVHVIAVRTYLLPESVSIENERRFGGCRSWVTLTAPVDLDGSRPVLAEEDLQRRVASMAEQLQ
jgi:hypothetical protein